MNTPGFTAEASLYKMNARYQEAVIRGVSNTTAVGPASIQNVTRLGSAIDRECYGECVRDCIREPGGPRPGACIRICRQVCRVD